MNDINYKQLETINGDFNLTYDATPLQQNQDIIIRSDKGQIINNLLLGVGITKYLHGPFNYISINREIKSECKKENINVSSFQIINNELYIKSNEI